MNKRKRQFRILELIKEYDIETQDELCNRLNAEGYGVTQATISRDINELQLYKVAMPKGGYRYDIVKGPGDVTKSTRVLKDSVLSVGDADRIVVIKTSSGMAMAAAAALDSMQFPQIVGTIAGDDTIICALKDSGEDKKLEEILKEMLFES